MTPGSVLGRHQSAEAAMLHTVAELDGPDGFTPDEPGFAS